jgi:hypothetical protein
MFKELKELEKFFKLCRKQGVTDISFEGIAVKFGELPNKMAAASEESEEVPTDALSPEELMFYAVENAGQT